MASFERSNESSPAQRPPGISGKRVTAWVLVALLAIGVGLSYILWTYNQLDTQRRASAEAWRSVTDHLDSRYRAAEKIVAEAVDDRRLPMEFGERFRLAVDSFRTTSLPEEQVLAAERAERLLSSAEFAPLAPQLGSATAAAQASIADYNAARASERRLVNSWGGRFLDIFLKLDPAARFEAEWTPSPN